MVRTIMRQVVADILECADAAITAAAEQMPADFSSEAHESITAAAPKRLRLLEEHSRRFDNRAPLRFVTMTCNFVHGIEQVLLPGKPNA